MKHGLEKLAAFTETEQELFSRAVNTLVANTFLVRSIDKDRQLYRFVLSNYDIFEDYFSWAGWSLRKDEHIGVITWYGPPGSRLNLNLEESLFLLVCRIMYEEKQNDITLGEDTAAKQEDLMEKYRVLTGRQLKKTAALQLIRRFQSLKLIRCMGSETSPDSLILLYPSIPFALDKENIDALFERLQELKSKNTAGNSNEAGDSEETDHDFDLTGDNNEEIYEEAAAGIEDKIDDMTVNGNECKKGEAG